MTKNFKDYLISVLISLRSRHLEVVGTRKNVRARRRHLCLPLACPGGTSIHYLYGYVPPNGVVILKLLI